MMSTNGAVQMASKASKKRKAKPAAAANPSSGGTASPAPDAPESTSSRRGSAAGVDGAAESPYLKDLNRNIRNIHKKLASSSKADAVIAENPGADIDDLVAAKKLNADQKAQVLKKPALQAQLKQLEEQLANYQSFGKEYEERFAREKAKLIENHEAELAQTKQDVAEEARGTYSQKQDEDLLVLSQFLHAAAAKRQSDVADTDEGRAFEGALLLVYQGNRASLTTLKNLIAGSEDKVPDVNGDLLEYSFAQVKQSAKDSALPSEIMEDETEAPATSSTGGDLTDAVTSDPTIMHAGLTELEDTAPTQANGAATHDVMAGAEQASAGNEAANATAESNWDPQASVLSNASAGGEGWVEVPREPVASETGVIATPVAVHGASSWAEEVTEGAAAEEKAAIENDGFEQVVHHPGRERGRVGRGRSSGDFRGRGDGFRGRGRGGDRGDGRGGGRGRGAGRGGEGGGFRGSNRGGRGSRGRDGHAAESS